MQRIVVPPKQEIGAIIKCMLAGQSEAPVLAERFCNPIVKTAIGSGVLSDVGWAGALAEGAKAIAATFESMQGMSPFFYARLNGMKRVKPGGNKRGIGLNALTAYSVGEAAPIPAAPMDFDNVDFQEQKVAVIMVVTEELARDTSPEAVTLITNETLKALSRKVDRIVLPGLLSASPPSTPASGNDADALLSDMRTMMGTVAPTGGEKLLWAAAPDTAQYLATISYSGGRAFPEVAPCGLSELLLCPFIATDALSSGELQLIDMASVAGDATDLLLSTATQAQVDMMSVPTGATTVSLFQSDSAAVKAVTRFTYAPIRANCSAKITAVGQVSG